MVSIIIPVYNVEKYLNRCLDSVVGQTYEDVQIILIDDGSTDNSGVICDDYAKTDDRIIVIHTENRGVSSARNEGLRIATGEYISFIDSDDWVSADFISTLMNLILTTQSDMAGCSIEYCSNNEFGSKVVCNQDFIEYNRKDAYYQILNSTKIGGFLSNKIFKKNLIEKYLDITIHMSEDFLFCVEYLKNVSKFAFIDCGLYYYFQRHQSDKQYLLQYNEKIFSLLTAKEKMIQIYLLEAPECLSKLCERYLMDALNIKGRYIYSKVQNEEQLVKIDSIIKEYYPIVIRDKRVRLFTKFNIFLTKRFPVQLLKIKANIIKR